MESCNVRWGDPQVNQDSVQQYEYDQQEGPYQQSLCFQSQPQIDAGRMSPLSSHEKHLPASILEYREKAGRESTSLASGYAGDLVTVVKEEFSQTKENYLRGCKWSPDGNFLLTNSNDNMLRVFQLADGSELPCVGRSQERELVYDFCWYSQMRADDAATCCFATTCRDFPIHLISTVTGSVVSSYRGYNHADEVVAANSVAFTPDGRHLLAGYNKTVRIFSTERPGRECVVKSTVFKDENSGRLEGQPGIISCFGCHPSHPDLFAAGSYRGDVGIYSAPSGEMCALFQGQIGGVTQVMFSADGYHLFAGGRKDPEIICWDLRNPGQHLLVMYRYVQTNQRMYFDIDCSGRYFFSGNHNGIVTVWDLVSEPKECLYTPWPHLDPMINFQAHSDTTNGCSAHPSYPLLATASGQRHFPLDELLEDSHSDDDGNGLDPEDRDLQENTLRLWLLKLPGYGGGAADAEKTTADGDEETDTCGQVHPECQDEETDTCGQVHTEVQDEETDTCGQVHTEVQDEETDTCGQVHTERQDEETDTCGQVHTECQDEETDTCGQVHTERQDEETDTCGQVHTGQDEETGACLQVHTEGQDDVPYCAEGLHVK